MHSLVLFDSIRCYHSGPEWTWEWWQWRATPYSPKLQYYWNLPIRLFGVISRILVWGGILPPCRGKGKRKVGDRSRGWPEGSIFNSYYIEVSGRALLLSLDCSALPLIRTLYCWVLSKEVSSTILKVFGMSWPGIEPKSPGPLANTLPTSQWEVQSVYSTAPTDWAKHLIGSYLWVKEY